MTKKQTQLLLLGLTSLFAGFATPVHAAVKYEYVSDSWGPPYQTKRALSRHVPMGPIGGFVRSRGEPRSGGEKLSKEERAWPELTVANLIKNAPGHKCGLKIGDVIYGVNGKALTPIDWSSSAGRRGAFRDLGLAIEDSEANRKGLLKLMVRRGVKGKGVIEIQLPPDAGGFGPTYPFNCPKSKKYFDSICNYLLATEKNGTWPAQCGNLGSSVIGLALMGHGDKKYMSAAKRSADARANSS